MTELLFIGGFGGVEVLVVLLIATLIFGADKIPELARQVGQGIGELQSTREEIEEEIQDATGEISEDVNEVRGEIKDIENEVEEVKEDVKVDTEIRNE